MGKDEVVLLRLFDRHPGEDGKGGREIEGNGYAPMAVPIEDLEFSGKGAVSSNKRTITFPEALHGAWDYGCMVLTDREGAHIAIFDSQGHVPAGESLEIASGGLVIH